MLPRESIEKLIEMSTRRLQKLKEQQALKGINSPPELLIEIEDIEAKIKRWQAELPKVDAYEAAQKTKIYILSSIPGGWSAPGYEELTDHKKLEETLNKVCQSDELISTSLSQLLHDYYQIRRAVSENKEPLSLASIAFIDLARNGADILEDISRVRTYLPTVVLILYTDEAEYQRLQDEVPEEWGSRFEHYYKLRKGRDLVFDTEVREILDVARATAIQTREARSEHKSS